MFFKSSFLILLLLIVSCSDVKNTRYKDTSHLETPPKMKIAEKPKAEIKENKEIKDKGLGDSVLLTGTDKKPVIKIKKLFDRSWTLVEQALKLSEIKITDKNREQGVFFVLFDPDAQNSGETELIDSLSFFFFEDEYEEAAYQLTVVWRENNTEVRAEPVDQDSSELLDDDEDRVDFEGNVDDGGKLLNTLYKIIRDDLPIN